MNIIGRIKRYWELIAKVREKINPQSLNKIKKGLLNIYFVKMYIFYF